MRKRLRAARAEATVTSKGQVTLPAALREELGISTGDKIRFERGHGERVVMTPVRRADPMSLAGVFSRAGGRIAGSDLERLRRRAWRRRGRKLEPPTRSE